MFGKKKGKKPFSLEEQVEWIAIAFVLALTVRCFIVEAYQIPTGSMAPTLYGKHWEVTCPECGEAFKLRRDGTLPPNPGGECPSCSCDLSDARPRIRGRGGDRILVSKNLYFFAEPQRWDVFVFKSPEAGSENMNFVKRLVGLPGETVEIKDGQIFIDGRIARKPARIQRSLWQEVYDGTRNGDCANYWLLGGGWNLSGQDLVLPQSTGGPHTVKYAAPILDSYSYNGNPGRNVVGDILVEAHVVIDQESGEFVACAWADSENWRAIFNPGASILDVELRHNERPRGRKTLLLESPGSFDFSLAAVDGAAEVRVDRKLIMRLERDPGPADTPLYTTASGLFFQGAGSRMLVRDIRIRRDIYYRADLARPDASLRASYRVMVPAGHYLGLGDNSPISRDSRQWGYIPQENVLGKAFFVFWPIMRIGPVS